MISKELQQGKAAEHLVVADLILAGYQAFLADAGSPYDVVIDVGGGRLDTIQVKSCARAKTTRRGKTPAYHFSLRQGRDGKAQNDQGIISWFAFVTIDTRHIAYLPTNALTRKGRLIQTITFRMPGVFAERRYSTGKLRQYDTYNVITSCPFPARGNG